MATLPAATRDARALAAAIRTLARSHALYVAAMTCDPGTPDEVLFSTAERYDTWIGQDPVPEPSASLGEPWPQ